MTEETEEVTEFCAGLLCIQKQVVKIKPLDPEMPASSSLFLCLRPFASLTANFENYVAFKEF